MPEPRAGAAVFAGAIHAAAPVKVLVAAPIPGSPRTRQRGGRGRGDEAKDSQRRRRGKGGQESSRRWERRHPRLAAAATGRRDPGRDRHRRGVRGKAGTRVQDRQSVTGVDATLKSLFSCMPL